MKTLDQRIAALEVANRRWRYAAAFLVIAAVTMAAAKPGGNVSDSTRTRRLEIVNEDDAVVAEIFSDDEGGGRLRLFDAGGVDRVKLEAGKLFTSLLMKDADSTEIFDVAGCDGDGVLFVFSEKNRSSAQILGNSIMLGLRGNGRIPNVPHDQLLPKMAQENEKRNRVTLGIYDGGGGFVQVRNLRGKVAAEMQVSKSNAGLIMANDFDGNVRQELAGDNR